MKRFCLVIFTILGLVNEVLARAGYGGGGGGRGGGMGRSYSSYGSRGGSVDGGIHVSLSMFVVSMLVFFAVVAAIYGLFRIVSSLYIKSYVKNSINIARFSINRAKATDDFWNEEVFKAKTEKFYLDLQRYWSQNDISPMKQEIGSKCYKKLDRELNKFRRKNRYNIVSNIEFEQIEIVGIRDYKDNSKDGFAVLYKGKMVDEILRKGQKSSTSKKASSFVDVYEFRRKQNDDIFLNRILPYSSVYDGQVKNLREV